MSANIMGTRIDITWADGLTHHFERQDNGTWTLILGGYGGMLEDGPRIVNYKRADLERVLGMAIEGTMEA